MKKRVVSSLLLVMVIPLIIGHGLACPPGGCPDCEDSDLDFDCDAMVTISGGPDSGTPLKGNGSTRFVVREQDSSDGEERDVHTSDYGEDRIARPFTLNFDASVDRLYMIEQADSDDAEFGEIWIHGDNHRYKLIHDRLVSRSDEPAFENVFRIASGLPRHRTPPSESPSIAATNGYTISSGGSGSSAVRVIDFELYVNGERVDIPRDGTHYYGPMLFQASPGDRIRIIAVDTDKLLGYISSIWLHKPDGTGIRLLRTVESTPELTAEVDLTFVAE